MEGLNQEIEIIIKETGEKEEQLVVSSFHPQSGLVVSSRAPSETAAILLSVFEFIPERMTV